MSRSVPWRNTCPKAVSEVLDQLPSCGLLLVRRIGPTSFLLSKQDSPVKYRTSVGDPHSCTCDDSREQCIHIVFVLCKVFYLPKENPLVWQRSLVAAEIDDILRSEICLRNAWKNVADTAGNSALPKPIEDGDVCPICFEELGNNTSLDICQKGCGKYIHTRCFKQYRRYNTVGPLRCPYCRGLWVQTSDATSKRCSGCAKYAYGPCYRCLFCQEYFLCSICFHHRDTHSNHPFSLVGKREVAQRGEMRTASPLPAPSGHVDGVGGDLLPLMYREIVPEDYETLLQLDEHNNRRKLDLMEFSMLHSENWSSGLLNDECNICLDSFDVTSSCVWLPCGHFFHALCARKWLTEHAAECPIDHIPVVVSKTDSQSASTDRSPPVAIVAGAPCTHRLRRPLRQGRWRFSAPSDLSNMRGVAPPWVNIERSNGSNISLPPLELRVMSLGLGQNRERMSERFFYGTV